MLSIEIGPVKSSELEEKNLNEGTRTLENINNLESSLNPLNNLNVRMAKYYRSLNPDTEPATEPAAESKQAIEMNQSNDGISSSVNHPLLNLQRKSLSKIYDKPEDVNFNVDSEIDSDSKQNAYYLPANYEYPELVSSLKNVYRELFITSVLYLINIVSAVGIVLVNKLIYSHYNFPNGLVLTLYHFVLTSIGLQVLAGIGMFPVKPIKLIKVLPLSVSFCSYVVLTNLSLQYNSGTFYQILVAPTIAFLQLIFFGIKTELALLPPMGIMLLGVALSTVSELKLSVIGLSIAFSGVLMTAIYQILVGTKQKQLGLTAIQLLYYQAPLSSLLLAIAAPFLTDISKVIHFEYSRGLVLAIITSACCAFFLNLSMYLVLGRSNALTYNVIGLSKLFLVLSLNYWLFERSSPLNVLNLSGVLMAFSGVCSFSYVKFKLMLRDESNNKKF